MMRRGLGLAMLALAAAGCGDGDSPRPVPTPTASATRTAIPTATTAAPTASDTPVPLSTASPQPSTPPASPTATPPASPTETPPPTPTATPLDTATPTPSATPAPPQLLFFGVARADDLVQAPDGVDEAGRPIYARAQGQGMTLVVEARRGQVRLSNQAYDPVNFAPGVEIIASRPLGDGSPAVCDYDPPLIGGIPAVEPLEFRDDPMVRDAIADLGCRFNDGAGAPLGRVGNNNACTRDAGALFNFVDPLTELQYCLPIAKAWAFPVGDTIVAARVRDAGGSLSEVREIVIRVAGDQPFDCNTGLGERAFTVRTPASELDADGFGKISTDAWLTASLRLCAGPDLGDGTHALTLRENAILGIPLTDGGVLCTQLRSRGSAGVLDCGSTLPQDVYATADQGTGHISVDTGLGVPAGTGSASLRLPIAFRVLPSGAAPTDCLTTSFGSVIAGAVTTAGATAEVLDAEGATVASLARNGAPFSCDEWVTGGAPVLVLPLPMTDPVAGAVATALVLAD
ncbi:hypothetical protein KF840_23810 [bacterium]|nr:hypothetical protein [bacterium]